jgi:hypothetical protein
MESNRYTSDSRTIAADSAMAGPSLVSTEPKKQDAFIVNLDRIEEHHK